MKRFLLLSLFLVCSFEFVDAQGVLDIRMDGSEQGKSLATVFSDLHKRYPRTRFYFLRKWVEPIVLDRAFQNQPLGQALDEIFLGTDLNYFVMDSLTLVVVKDPSQDLLHQNVIDSAIRERTKITPYSFGDPSRPKRGKPILTGTIIDAKTRQPLPGATIRVIDLDIGSVTNGEGKYSLTLPNGSHVISFSSVDHEDNVVDLRIYDDASVDIQMAEKPIYLEEVLIQDTYENATSRLGQMQITMREIKRSPSLLGEADIVKQIQLLPGVTTVGEAATGFNVRGGSVDQNLILYDGMPAFSSSHVFGFLSAFNPEAVQSVTFYKGGIPAEFGGRASSVLDIRAKDGNMEKWNGNAGIGTLTTNFMINGPIVKNKTSVSASLRTTYSDWLIHTVRTNYADLRQSTVGFYDGTFKLTHAVSSRTRVSFTGYISKDAFRLKGDTTYQWNNMQGSLRLSHRFSDQLTADFVAGISNYHYKVLNSDELTSSDINFSITTPQLQAGFTLTKGEHKISFGGLLSYYNFNPGSLSPSSVESTAATISPRHQYAMENAFYGSDSWKLKENLFAEAGLRLPIFTAFGPADINTYKANEERSVDNIADTLHFKSMQPIKTYVGVEPRLSLRWMTGPVSSFKFGYNRIYQFLHLITNTAAVTPIDIWQPSGYYFKPQHADQVSAGYFLDFSEKKYSFSVESFYKALTNAIDFKDGARLTLNNHLETDLLQGRGWSYGIETSLSKNMGRLTGSVNYTFSRSFRKIPGINTGNSYPSNFDQPHIANLSWKYQLARRYYFTGNFTYHTGRPVTIPASAFPVEHSTVALFSARNQYRIPDYHRLDIAIVLEGNHKKNKWASGTWVFSIYNVYGRRNPYTIFFKSSGNGLPQPYELSIVGTILPAISYNIKF